jgi:hypothetical protein
MGSVGSIEVLAPGAHASEILDCLRVKAGYYDIGVEDGAAGVLAVTDIGGHADDLPAFLRHQLNVCSAELGYDWRDFIAVTLPQAD